MSYQPDAVLLVEKGMGEPKVIPLDREVCLLGKSRSADIVVDHAHVSRRHAQITLEGGHFSIRDLGSKNGTFVNGSRQGGEDHTLHSGDLIELARGQVILRFQAWGTTITLAPLAQAPSADMRVDDRRREVWVLGQKLEPPLSRKEFDVLHYLYQRRGEACSKDDIASHGWPEREGGDVGDQEIEQCIRRLRLRVEPNPSQPQRIVNIRGYGYKLSQG